MLPCKDSPHEVKVWVEETDDYKRSKDASVQVVVALLNDEIKRVRLLVRASGAARNG